MLEFPSYQSYPNDWETDYETIDWDMEQMGAYHQLINKIWIESGEILLDFSKLSKIFRKKTEKSTVKLWKRIEKKFIFIEKDGETYIQHNRVNKERKRLQEQRLRKQEAGSLGGRKKAKNSSKAIAEIKPLPSLSSSSSITSSITPSITKKSKRAAFAPPTLDEALNHASSKGHQGNLDGFFDHYKSNGWKVGKNKMVCWKSALSKAINQGWAESKKGGNNGSGTKAFKSPPKLSEQKSSIGERIEM